MAGRIPLEVFTPAELAELYRQRNETVLQWYPLVWKVAKSLWNNRPAVRTIGSIEDLVQVGTLAVIEAVKGYDPTYRNEDGEQVTFMTYVYRAVMNNMLREACADTLIYVPQYIRKAIAGLPSKARYVEEGRRALKCGYLPNHFQGTAKVEEGKEDERLSYLHQAISFLEPDDRKLLVERYGLDGQSPKTFRQLAEERGRTRERMRQRIYRICEKLKGHMPGDGNAGAAADRQAAS